jgi:hypothetical protein
VTVSEARKFKDSPDPRVAAEARRVLDARAAAKARKRARPARAAGPTAADKKSADAERLERLAAIRVALHAETGGRCVICGLGLPFARMHAHHILSGPERRSEERQETMAPTHEKCHDWLHGKDARLDQRDALVALMAWCEATGRAEAMASTVRRIAKIDGARTPSVPVRLEVRP